MNKLLTIAIPTFNRAKLLDKQVAWLAKVIKGYESECEIFISDNCSTDNTQDIIKKWQLVLGYTVLRANKNSENVGLVGNIACCLNAANSKYVWTIGDDDPIQDRTLTYVVQHLKKYPELSLIFLNFSGRDQKTGKPINPPKIVGERWFDIEQEEVTTNGKAVFESCLKKSIGSVMFISSAVYRTELVQSAIQKWSTSLNNWIAQVYWTGYCAAHGSVLITKDTYMECTIGVSYWQKDPKHALMMQYKNTPEVILKLKEIGYSDAFRRRMLLHFFKEAQPRVFLGALKKWPRLAVNTVIPFLAVVSISAIEMGIPKNIRIVEENLPKQENTRSNSNSKEVYDTQ